MFGSASKTETTLAGETDVCIFVNGSIMDTRVELIESFKQSPLAINPFVIFAITLMSSQLNTWLSQLNNCLHLITRMENAVWNMSTTA